MGPDTSASRNLASRHLGNVNVLLPGHNLSISSLQPDQFCTLIQKGVRIPSTLFNATTEADMVMTAKLKAALDTLSGRDRDRSGDAASAAHYRDTYTAHTLNMLQRESKDLHCAKDPQDNLTGGPAPGSPRMNKLCMDFLDARRDEGTSYLMLLKEGKLADVAPVLRKEALVMPQVVVSPRPVRNGNSQKYIIDLFNYCRTHGDFRDIACISAAYMAPHDHDLLRAALDVALPRLGRFMFWWLLSRTMLPGDECATTDRFLAPGLAEKFLLDRCLLHWYDLYRADRDGSRKIPPPPSPLYPAMGATAAKQFLDTPPNADGSNAAAPPDYREAGLSLLRTAGNVMHAMRRANVEAAGKNLLVDDAVFPGPKGFLLAGGAAANAARPAHLREAINLSDFDIWAVGFVSPEAYVEALSIFLRHLQLHYDFAETFLMECAITLKLDPRNCGERRRTDSGLRVQIILKAYFSGSELLLSFDYDMIMFLVTAMGETWGLSRAFAFTKADLPRRMHGSDTRPHARPSLQRAGNVVLLSSDTC
ncbi:hypothetical protein HYH03_000746 [Edaphochlamys debaryana]|uniref:Uncharacterized protein n=1 Tax=Edaphochlamys debaryana TaxID=47281 RepID=A0A836C6H1_9CHLO|nr:hypothetical protein HYH03_000746 [Edaphochlamys debaryana]|eukprot:KAG2500919.1 hypothetical protein HYH03_000746 [Edaphochlamys debaryana]